MYDNNNNAVRAGRFRSERFNEDHRDDDVDDDDDDGDDDDDDHNNSNNNNNNDDDENNHDNNNRFTTVETERSRVGRNRCRVRRTQYTIWVHGAPSETVGPQGLSSCVYRRAACKIENRLRVVRNNRVFSDL